MYGYIMWVLVVVVKIEMDMETEGDQHKSNLATKNWHETTGHSYTYVHDGVRKRQYIDKIPHAETFLHHYLYLTCSHYLRPMHASVNAI